jgi:glycosyltransferase involved in cell wall biosynthesis
LIQSQPKGIAKSMNMGIKNANGKFLFFLNSDDYFYDNNVLDKVFNHIIKNKYSWYYGMINVISDKDNIQRIYPSRRYQKKFHYWLLKLIFLMPHQGTFYSKNLFNKYGLYDESLNAMDYEYAIRIGKKDKAQFMNIVISNFYLGGFSSKNLKIMKKDIDKIFKKHFQLYFFWNFIHKLLWGPIHRFYIKYNKKQDVLGYDKI